MAKKRGKQEADSWFEDYLKQHAFQGEVEFDLTFEMLGERFIRRARIAFAHTPGWEHLDPKSKTLREGAEMMSTYHIELHAEPDKGSLIEGGPYWIGFQDLIRDDVMPDSVLNAIANAIEERCRAEDTDRRWAAGIGK